MWRFVCIQWLYSHTPAVSARRPLVWQPVTMQKSPPMSLFPLCIRRAWLVETSRIGWVHWYASALLSKEFYAIVVYTHICRTHIDTVEMTNVWIYTEQRNKSERLWERGSIMIEWNLISRCPWRLNSLLTLENELLFSLIYRELKPRRHNCASCCFPSFCTSVQSHWGSFSHSETTGCEQDEFNNFVDPVHFLLVPFLC